ncbi:MAG: 50S ribosomal protein L10 [Bythopirellula sp.]|nr:50S ribosomal protein L10 [Bythopirellula sp.]
MSKYVKDLITNELKSRLAGVADALLVDVVGMEANSNVELRKELRKKNMHLLVVKNSLGRRATEGTTLAPAFEGSAGTLAIVWGGEDVVSLAKEITRLAANAKYKPFAPKGGVMDGSKLSADDVKAVSKWPSREEQLSILMGQILSPGAMLSSQLLGPGGKLASQIKQKGEETDSVDQTT